MFLVLIKFENTENILKIFHFNCMKIKEKKREILTSAFYACFIGIDVFDCVSVVNSMT